MSKKIVRTTLRINLENDADQRAWHYLQRLDDTSHKSISQAIVSAVNEYFERLERLTADPFLESREKENAFLQRVLDTIAKGIQENASLGTIGGLAQLLQGGAVASPSMPETEIADKDASDQSALEFLSNFGV